MQQEIDAAAGEMKPGANHTNKALLEQMTWPDARQAALNGGRVVLLPVGAIEQHGPHLPVDFDNRIVTWLCDEAARRRPDLYLDPERLLMECAVVDMIAARSSFIWVDLMAGDGPVAQIDDWSRISNGSGVDGDPTTASAEKGRLYAEEEVHNLIHFCEEFKAMPTLPRRNYTARGTDANPYV